MQNETSAPTVDPNTFPDSISRDFAMAMDGAWLKTKESSFADVTQSYKDVESAFLLRAAGNDLFLLEIRRDRKSVV